MPADFHPARPALRAYTILEMVVCVVVLALLSVAVATAGWKVYESSALGVSAANIRQLSAGAQGYLADHEHRFWPFAELGATIVDSEGNEIRGTRWWFGFETEFSSARGEGERDFDPSQGPLAGYVPKGLRPDPSLALHGSALKPKFKHGYLGVGYNVVLAGGWGANQEMLAKDTKPPRSLWQLRHPPRVVVFATSAQVNDFQAPASPDNPKIEEFYGFDHQEVTIHFRHGGSALVAYADGSGGFLPMDETTRDPRLPKANIGRFAPRGSYRYLR